MPRDEMFTEILYLLNMEDLSEMRDEARSFLTGLDDQQLGHVHWCMTTTAMNIHLVLPK